jgi:hypothetical protein
MMKPPTLILSLAFTALAAVVAPAAHAAVCVQLDTTHDNLTDQERAGTMTMLVQTLQQQGQQVATEGCQGTYVVYHVRLGYSVNVVLQGPGGYRQGTARAIEEVPALYSQMIRSLLTGQPMNTANGTVDRTNVTSGQVAPNRVDADSLWYARLGYAGIAGPSFGGGPAFGFGYRYELDSIGIDFSFLNFVVPSSNSSSGSVGISWSLIKLEGLYFLNPIANGSIYLGAGASWGLMAVGNGNSTATSTTINTLTGSGLQGEATVGYEFLRASTIRMFAQADATLPFYKVSGSTTTFDAMGNPTTSTSDTWAPIFTLSVGIGWGRGTARVHLVP